MERVFRGAVDARGKGKFIACASCRGKPWRASRLLGSGRNSCGNFRKIAIFGEISSGVAGSGGLGDRGLEEDSEASGNSSSPDPKGKILSKSCRKNDRRTDCGRECRHGLPGKRAELRIQFAPDGTLYEHGLGKRGAAGDGPEQVRFVHRYWRSTQGSRRHFAGSESCGHQCGNWKRRRGVARAGSGWRNDRDAWFFRCGEISAHQCTSRRGAAENWRGTRGRRSWKAYHDFTSPHGCPWGRNTH